MFPTGHVPHTIHKMCMHILYFCVCLCVNVYPPKRYLLGWWASSAVLLAFSQLGHSVSYALNHVANMGVLTAEVPEPLQGQAQALYVSVGFGLASMVGSLATGYLWREGESVEEGPQVQAAAFGFSIICSLLSGVCYVLSAHFKTPAKAELPVPTGVTQQLLVALLPNSDDSSVWSPEAFRSRCRQRRCLHLVSELRCTHCSTRTRDGR